MPLPFVALLPALLAGGVLVPHAAGGLIVTGASGYVAGTFLSTATISSLVSTAVYGGTALVSVVGSTVIGGLLWLAGGTTAIVGSTDGGPGMAGIIGLLTSPVPMWVPIASVVAMAAGTAFIIKARRIKRLLESIRKKTAATPAGEEASFTEDEALLIQKMILKAEHKGILKIEYKEDDSR